MKKTVLTLLYSLSTCLYAEGILDSMNDAEIKACGIEKLSPDEKIALHAWFAVKTAPKPAPAAGVTIEHGTFTITSIIDLGHFVKLDNGLSYDIYSRSRKKTMAWKVGDTVELIEPIRRKSYKMTNRSKKQTVAAKETL